MVEKKQIPSIKEFIVIELEAVAVVVVVGFESDFVVTVAVDAVVVVVSSLFTRMHKKSTKVIAKIKFFENIFKIFLIFL